jgi:hypothetical protein
MSSLVSGGFDGGGLRSRIFAARLVRFICKGQKKAYQETAPRPDPRDGDKQNLICIELMARCCASG